MLRAVSNTTYQHLTFSYMARDTPNAQLHLVESGCNAGWQFLGGTELLFPRDARQAKTASGPCRRTRGNKIQDIERMTVRRRWESAMEVLFERVRVSIILGTDDDRRGMDWTEMGSFSEWAGFHEGTVRMQMVSHRSVHDPGASGIWTFVYRIYSCWKYLI